jgi:hypothetical protein
MRTERVAHISFWARTVVLLALTACGHAHGCDGLSHMPSGHGSMHSAGHATVTSGAFSGGHGGPAGLGDAARLLDGIRPLAYHSASGSSLGPTGAGITVLAEDSEVSSEIVASGTMAYWVDRSLSSPDAIRSVALEGGVAMTLYECSRDGDWTIRSLALDSKYIYWAESTLEGPEMSFLKRMPASGGAVESISAVRHRIKQIAVDPPYLYSVDEVALRVMRLSDWRETTIGAVPSSSEGPALAADRGDVLWLGLADRTSRAIQTAKSPRFQLAPLTRREGAVTAMSLGGSSLYWVEYEGSNNGSSVFVIDRGGDTPLRVFESNRLNATSSYGHSLIAADDDGVYFMVDGSGPLDDGTIYKGARASEVRVVVSGVGGPGGLALSGGWLVFTDMGAGLVVRAPK